MCKDIGNVEAGNRWRLLHDLMNVMLDKMDNYRFHHKTYSDEITKEDVDLMIDYLKKSVENIENLEDKNILWVGL
jgi:hypothetical protein